MSKIDRTLTIAECIELWEKEEELSTKIAHLEGERAILRDDVDNLRKANRQLRINVAKIFYNIGEMLEITGIPDDISYK